MLFSQFTKTTQEFKTTQELTTFECINRMSKIQLMHASQRGAVFIESVTVVRGWGLRRRIFYAMVLRSTENSFQKDIRNVLEITRTFVVRIIEKRLCVCNMRFMENFIQFHFNRWTFIPAEHHQRFCTLNVNLYVYFRLPFFFLASGHGNPLTLRTSCKNMWLLQSRSKVAGNADYLDIVTNVVGILHSPLIENVTLKLWWFSRASSASGSFFLGLSATSLLLPVPAPGWIFAITLFLVFPRHVWPLNPLLRYQYRSNLP